MIDVGAVSSVRGAAASVASGTVGGGHASVLLHSASMTVPVTQAPVNIISKSGSHGVAKAVSRAVTSSRRAVVRERRDNLVHHASGA